MYYYLSINGRMTSGNTRLCSVAADKNVRQILAGLLEIVASKYYTPRGRPLLILEKRSRLDREPRPSTNVQYPRGFLNQIASDQVVGPGTSSTCNGTGVYEMEAHGC